MLMNQFWGMIWLDLSNSGYGEVEGYSEHGYELVEFIKYGEFLD